MNSTIYIDGSCLGNPGRGGFAVITVHNDKIISEFSGGSAYTTNNRMELRAALNALQICKKSSIIYTDSRYVQKGITEWLPIWKANNWRRKKGKLKNIDLWKEFDRLISNSPGKFEWKWVKAHSDNKWNNYVDKLAKQAALQF